MILKYKKIFAEILAKNIPELDEKKIFDLIEIPPENISGDLGFPCFNLSKILKNNPSVIAKNIYEKLNSLKNLPDIFFKFEVVGPYLNVHFDYKILAQKVLVNVYENGENFGFGKPKNELVLIESPGPNTNKPLHLGHVRNLLLGNAMENILKFGGYKVKRVDIVNDRGIHICKSMLAYKLFGNNMDPDKKSDHFVGDWYVKYAKEVEKNPELEILAKKMLVDWENGDKKVRELWKKMNGRALDGIHKTYERFGVKIDKAYLESEYYLKGKEKVLQEFDKGIFEKDVKGNIIFKSENDNLGTKVVLRADGTSIYSTNDIGVIQGRFEDFAMDRMIYVVGNEQEDYFKILFEIFEKIGYSFAKKCFHLSYGMISLPSGKMKSREGKVIDADNLVDEMKMESMKLLKQKYENIDGNNMDKKAETIAMGAIKYFILKYDVNKNFVFNPEESLSFEGETGPYLQYTFARINSILMKSKKNINCEGVDFSLLDKKEEKNILLKMLEFNSVINKSVKNYKPNLVARFALELAKLFNNYYQKYKIIQGNDELQKVRLLLIKDVQINLKIALNLLGIDVLDKM